MTLKNYVRICCCKVNATTVSGLNCLIRAITAVIAVIQSVVLSNVQTIALSAVLAVFYIFLLYSFRRKNGTVLRGYAIFEWILLIPLTVCYVISCSLVVLFLAGIVQLNDDALHTKYITGWTELTPHQIEQLGWWSLPVLAVSGVLLFLYSRLPLAMWRCGTLFNAALTEQKDQQRVNQYYAIKA